MLFTCSEFVLNLGFKYLNSLNPLLVQKKKIFIDNYFLITHYLLHNRKMSALLP